MSVSPYLLVSDVAERFHLSPGWVHQRTRCAEIPHRKLPGSRRCLFIADELDRWVAGAELETVELPRGGRIVRPKP